MRIINTAQLQRNSELTADETDWIYNGLDCCVTAEILEALLPQLDDVAQRTYDFSRALQAPVLEMSMRGILVNQVKRMKVVREMKGKLVQLEEQLNQIVRDGLGTSVNWRSPKQVNALFYEVLGCPVQKKRNPQTGKYGPTTDRGALEKLQDYFYAEPICNHILTLRDLGKSIGFLETEIDRDGRMRSNINIAGTVTGRFASSISDFGTGTNLQNVARSLRSIFVADPGYKFCNLDLEQGDSRNVGAICWESFVEERGEKFAGSYLDACESGDLHTLVTRMGNPDLQWGKDGLTDRQIADMIAYRDNSYRDLAKKLGHGSNYLGTPPTMAKHAKIPVTDAKKFQENYFNAFPCIPSWHQNVFWQLSNGATITSLLGRRRKFWGRPTESSTRRDAVAYAPQSMTGDEINGGILKIWRANRVQLLIQVHDSILLQYPAELENEIVPWALETLKVPMTLKRGREFVVPTEAKIGWNWGEFDAAANPDGLKKWKGGDDRKRQETQFKLSLAGF